MTNTTTTYPTPGEWAAAGRHARLVNREDLRAACFWYAGIFTLAEMAEGFCCGEQGALTRIAALEAEALAFTREFTGRVTADPEGFGEFTNKLARRAHRVATGH